MSEVAAFAEKVIKQFAERITDEVFLSIENDPKLMREYLLLVDGNSLKAVNTTIGKKVKEKFKLDSSSVKQKQPKSKLILSHETLEMD